MFDSFSEGGVFVGRSVAAMALVMGIAIVLHLV